MNLAPLIVHVIAPLTKTSVGSLSEAGHMYVEIDGISYGFESTEGSMSSPGFVSTADDELYADVALSHRDKFTFYVDKLQRDKAIAICVGFWANEYYNAFHSSCVDFVFSVLRLSGALGTAPDISDVPLVPWACRGKLRHLRDINHIFTGV